MRLAVISDTHVPRFARRFPALVHRIDAERPDAILHCGDFTTLDLVNVFEGIAPFDAVAGNNDGPEIVTRFGRTKIVTVAGYRIGLVHGDGGGKPTLARAEAAFANEAVDAILFGHSHVPLLQRRDETWLVNPGSGTDKRSQPRYSYAMLDIDAAGLRARLVYFGAA